MTAVLITGGTGFIGSRLALKCAQQGERVRVFARRNTPAERQNLEKLQREGIEVLEGSVTDVESLQRAVAGVDVVYHLAAAQHEVNVPDQYFYDVNVCGTRNTLEAAVRAGVSRFVHGSTIGVFGPSRNGPVNADSPLAPDNIYGITKLDGERVVHEFFDRLPTSIVRISETYGPGDWRLLKLYRGIAKGTFFMIGPGRNLHHPVYIDDLVHGLRQAARVEAAVGKTYVVAGPKAITTVEMVQGIAQAIERNGPRLRIPLWPMMATAVAMETAMRPFGVQPPLHRRRMNFFVKSFRFEPEPARRELAFEPKFEFEVGARETAAWYKSRNLI